MNLNNYLLANTKSMEILDLESLNKINASDSESAGQYFQKRVEAF